MTDMGPVSKRSVARLRRLTQLLEEKLTDPSAALELLVAEAEQGDPHPELWESLHGAAARDEKLPELRAAYEQLARGRRLQALSVPQQTETLMHAADYFLVMLGDGEASAGFLERVLAADPEHVEAFTRLEHKYTALRDDRRLAQMLILVAASKPEPPILLIGRALGLIELLPADQPLPMDCCESLVRIGAKNPRVLTVLEAHCRKGGRFTEATALLELGVATGFLEPADLLETHRRLVALHMGEAKTPEGAIPHVEALLQANAQHPEARRAAERLLGHTSVAARAAAALQDARRR